MDFLITRQYTLPARYSTEAQTWRAVEHESRPETKNTLEGLIRDRSSWTLVRPTDNIIYITFVKNGWVPGWYAPILEDYDVESNTMSAHTSFYCIVFWQSIFGTSELDPSSTTRRSFLKMKGTEEEKAVWSFDRVLLLCCMTAVAWEINIDLAFIQFIECTPPLDEMHRVIYCVCPRGSILDEIYHTVRPELVNYDMGTLDVAKWYGMEPLVFIAECFYIVLKNPAVRTLTSNPTAHIIGSMWITLEPPYSLSWDNEDCQC